LSNRNCFDLLVKMITVFIVRCSSFKSLAMQM